MIEIVRCQMAAAISRSVAFDLALFSPFSKDSTGVAKRSTSTLPCLSVLIGLFKGAFRKAAGGPPASLSTKVPGGGGLVFPAGSTGNADDEGLKQSLVG
jgi:hypothetical protein